MNYYIVSDVHGFYKELFFALKDKEYYTDPKPHKLIICGDLFDRGKEALKVQEFVLNLMAKNEVVLVRGNHEDLVLDLLDYANEYFYNKVAIPRLHHYRNGTIDTLLQLTGLSFEEAISNVPVFVKAARQTPYISKIIPAMLNYFETEKYIFVHGWIPCIKYHSDNFSFYKPYDGEWRNADEKAWERARWYNGIECACGSNILEPTKTIVCGHYHCSYGHFKFGFGTEELGKSADFSPFFANGIIAIDACTAYSGKVNCIVLSET